MWKKIVLILNEFKVIKVIKTVLFLFSISLKYIFKVLKILYYFSKDVNCFKTIRVFLEIENQKFLPLCEFNDNISKNLLTPYKQSYFYSTNQIFTKSNVIDFWSMKNDSEPLCIGGASFTINYGFDSSSNHSAFVTSFRDGATIEAFSTIKLGSAILNLI